MAIQKVLGIETEYGIIVRGGDSNPIAASSILINAYVQGLARAGAATGAARVGWDFEDEQPGNDARGFNAEGQMPPEVETHLVNAVLTNGARYYVDHAHPELSTPECADPRSIVVYDRAAELILHRALAGATALLAGGRAGVVER
jgi:proteasome accessory factor A